MTNLSITGLSLEDPGAGWAHSFEHCVVVHPDFNGTSYDLIGYAQQNGAYVEGRESQECSYLIRSEKTDGKQTVLNYGGVHRTFNGI